MVIKKRKFFGLSTNFIDEWRGVADRELRLLPLSPGGTFRWQLTTFDSLGGG
jgi:hypothetical protein